MQRREDKRRKRKKVLYHTLMLVTIRNKVRTGNILGEMFAHLLKLYK